MPKSILVPYSPENPPEPRNEGDAEVIRWVRAELQKIQGALLGEHVALTVTTTDAQVIGPALNWIQMFDSAVIPIWDVPGGSWDNPAIGQYLVPQAGLYMVGAELEVAPFGIGNKNYYAGVRVSITPQGGTERFITVTDGGDDDIPLGVTLAINVPLLQGDVVIPQITMVHENQTGLVDTSSIFTLYNLT